MTCEPAEVSLLNGFRDLTLMGVQVRKCCEIRNVRFLFFQQILQILFSTMHMV